MSCCFCVKKKKVRDLPEVHCRLNTILVNECEDDLKFYYEVQTFIENKTYKSLHHYMDFLNLSDELQHKYTPEKCFWLSELPPSIKIISIHDCPKGKKLRELKIRIAHEFLEKLCSHPEFLNETVLNFLGIKNSHQKVFLKYQNDLKKTRRNNQDTQSLIGKEEFFLE